MGRGVGVAADYGHAGLGHPELRADDVNDALVAITQGVDADSELGRIPAQCLHLGPGDGIRDGCEDVQRRGVVILGRQGEIRTAHPPAVHPQALEGLRARDLVHQVQVDVEKVGFTIDSAHDVRIPNLLGEGLPHFHASSLRLVAGQGLPDGDTLSCMSNIRNDNLGIWTKEAELEFSTRRRLC